MNGSEQIDHRERLPAQHSALRQTIAVVGIVAAVVLGAGCSNSVDRVVVDSNIGDTHRCCERSSGTVRRHDLPTRLTGALTLPLGHGVECPDADEERLEHA